MSDVELLSAITKVASYEIEIYICMYILLRNNQHHQKKYPSGKVREAVARYQNDTKSKNISS